MEKEAHRKIYLTLSNSLLCELDGQAKLENKTRSEFVSLAVKQYLREKRRIEAKRRMEQGYLEMGGINRDIAEKSLLSDESALQIYEKFLSESEN